MQDKSAATYRHLPAFLAADSHVWRSSGCPTPLGAHVDIAEGGLDSKYTMAREKKFKR